MSKCYDIAGNEADDPWVIATDVLDGVRLNLRTLGYSEDEISNITLVVEDYIINRYGYD